ncbi:hypothetical protein Taro_021723 [Colocasia esculenta]|uniref:Secreted protein n=1 Tax=Colocasia esculenta TaxID=4460 RepID=A0A843UZU0_COLES|nr:hypothetical protein [Colocasia esculenta]
MCVEVVCGALAFVALLESAVHMLGAPGSEVSQARGSARGLSRYSGTVRVLSSSWTPSLSRRVAVRMRERRQWTVTCESLCLVTCSALVVGGTDTSRRTGPQLVLFPVPHFRELRPESLKVTGMGLRGVTYRCGSLTCVNDIPCEALARLREAESCQARYQVNGFERCGPS